MEPKKPNKDPKYFTAILQLRFLREEIVQYLKHAVNTDVKENTFISKEVFHNNGVDYYVSSNKFARRIARELVDKFGGKLSESEKLFSFNKMTSKNIYRMNILIEFPLFLKNDCILFRKKAYLVKQIGKNVSVLDIESGKKDIVQYKNLKDIMILNKFETRVVKLYPKLAVLDEENNVVEIKNVPKKSLKEGEKVKVVFNNGCYLV